MGPENDLRSCQYDRDHQFIDPCVRAPQDEA